jgi:hypothetical protein
MTIYHGYISAGSIFSSRIKEDNILEYHLNCRDLKNRTCIQIMAQNRLYEILNDDNIGAIIGKYWGGDTMLYGLSDICSLNYITRYNLFGEVIKFKNFTKEYNKDRHFYFNYYSFRNIVSQRYFFKELYNIFLVACYQVLIYLAVTEQDLQKTVDGSYGILQTVTFYGSLTLLLNKINSIIFFSFVNRWYIEIDNHIFEILFLCSLLIHFLDLKNWFLDADDQQNRELMSAILLSHQISFLWWRVIDSLKATRLYGGFLRTVFVTISKLFLFLVFFYCFIIMVTGIFNLLFQQYTQFATYYDTFFYLVQAALQSYSFLPMWSQYLKFSLLFFMIICTVILMNLIIALTTKIYDDVDEHIQSEHRSNLIKIYEYLRFDENFGIFKFLSAPFNIIQIPFSLIVLFSENKLYWNELSCSICFITIALFYFILFLIYSTVRIPFALIYQIFINCTRYASLSRICTWVLLGWIYCIYYYLVDLVNFWYYAFRLQIPAEDKELAERQKLLEMRKLYSILIKDIAEIVENDKKSYKFSVGDLFASWFKKAGSKSSNLVENRIHKKLIVTSKYNYEKKSSSSSNIQIRSSHASLIKGLSDKISIWDHFKKGLAFIEKFCDKDG